ncbi:MAG TPA: RNase A-like domain-containing protein [Nocardioides sp.]|nr:RNase A-like domain-containing protein [Nocardioides sp.]
MRITVECSGFTRAADACLTANHVAALLTESLSSRLTTSAGMAGDDATSIDFATAYDAAAAEAVAALADLTHAFTGAGRLLAATGDNHERAEAGAAQLPYDGIAVLDDSAFARVDPLSPPSSLGAQEPSLGVVDGWILDQLEGFVWPGADVAALTVAASEWRHAAATTARLADHVDVAIGLLEAQRSPEVPLAVDALTELTTLIGDTAWQLSNLATACEEYAAAVEAARERTRALLAEVSQMIVEGAAISVIVTGLTGGLAGGAAAAAAAARVRSAAPRFYALLVSLRAGVATAAARVERARDDLADVRARLEKFLRVQARDEAGTIKGPGGGLPRRRGWLRDHEVPPGHTLERHVGKTLDELRERLRQRPQVPLASSFTDQRTAERLIASVLDRRAADIESWLRNPGGRLKLIEDLDEGTGISVARDGTVRTPTGIRVVLMPDSSTSAGWRILTAFPD